MEYHATAQNTIVSKAIFSSKHAEACGWSFLTRASQVGEYKDGVVEDKDEETDTLRRQEEGNGRYRGCAEGQRSQLKAVSSGADIEECFGRLACRQ